MQGHQVEPSQGHCARRMLCAFAATTWLAIPCVGCFVPPDDGIARSDTEQPEREPVEETEQQDSPWGQFDQPVQEPGAAPEDPETEEEQRQEANELARRARQKLEDSEPQQAVEYLQQAVNLTPNRAVLWQNLAAAQLATGEFGPAETSAQRALDLSGSREHGVIRESWWVIAAARKELGDDRGLRRAVEAASRDTAANQDSQPGQDRSTPPAEPWHAP